MRNVAIIYWIIIVFFVLFTFVIQKFESADTIIAKMDGMVLVDTNGTKWIAKHNLGDNYILKKYRD